MRIVRIPLADEAATEALARCIARVARVGDVIALSGEIGTGKTVFARAFIRDRLGAPVDVPSPTFTLVQIYDGNAGTPSVWHVDLYRLERAEDAWDLGIDEAFAIGIALIEWPERALDLLPLGHLHIHLEAGQNPDERRVTMHLYGDWPERGAFDAGF